jgi:hypothetical protein
MGAPGARYRSVFTVDPGGTTGVCWALVPGVQDPSIELVDAFLDDRMVTAQIGGDEDEQALAVAQWWTSSRAKARRLAKADNEAQRPTSEFVCESFTLLRPESDTSLLSPVRLIAKYELLRHLGYFEGATHFGYQQPSQKSIVTDEQLQRWGLWLPGQPHACDAVRHAVLRLRTGQ